MEPFRELLKKPGGKAVLLGQAVGAPLTSAKDTIGRLAAEGLRFYDVSRPTAVLTGYSRQGIGFLVLQQYCGVCLGEVAAMLPWRVETCALWQPTSHSGREELQYPRGRSACHRLVPKEGTPLPPWLPKTSRSSRATRPFKDFRRQGTKGHSQPPDPQPKEKTLMFTFRIKYLEGRHQLRGRRLVALTRSCRVGQKDRTKTMKSWYAQP
ncbi:hypothetical protein GWK47_041627 [Chionoecetes opilio]|uniref:Uncharacterized protein n=1 Tax=Chionoecetes opilio TaxID=41210 RepID=A0A8J5CZD3_CHIOP|nr:hypothetical protein GWK47_041627 [Chionoecetes opilio]